MKKVLLLTLLSILASLCSAAQSYYVMPLRDLEFAKDSPWHEENLGSTQIRNNSPFNVPPPLALAFRGVIDGDKPVYIAAPMDDERETLNSYRIAFMLDTDEVVQGQLTLPLHSWSLDTRTCAFSFDPSAFEPTEKIEYDQIKKAHYARLAHARDPLPGTAWFDLQSQPDEATATDTSSPQNQTRNRRNNVHEMRETLELFGGGRALSENLALDRDLILAEDANKERVAIDSIEGITVDPINWSARLDDKEVAVDPLSLQIPLDQYAVFFPSYSDLVKTTDLIESDGISSLQAFTLRNAYAGLPERYRKQMLLADLPVELSKLLPIKSVAVTGDSPFFPTGAAVTVLFETDQADALYALLKTTIEQSAKTKGVTRIDSPDAKLNYIGFQSDDRATSSHLFRHGDTIGVTNSPAQVDKILSASDGMTEALGRTDEYRFFRNRYPLADKETAFFFLSDAALRQWCSPAFRIGMSQRLRAIAALSNLSARVADGQEMTDAFKPLLGERSLLDDLVHSENFNTLDFITPVSELELDSVSAAEAVAYNNWRRRYERGWSAAFDPIAIRLVSEEDKQLLDISVIPLTVNSDYQQFIEFVGNASLDRSSRSVDDNNVYKISVAIDRESQPFLAASGFSTTMIPTPDINPLSWVGDSASVFMDTGMFWELVAEHGEAAFEMGVRKMPLGVRVSSESSAKLAIALTALRTMVGQSAPGMLEWKPAEYNDHDYVEVVAKDENLSIFYAPMKTALLISVNEDTLKAALDRELLGEEQAEPVTDAQHLFSSLRLEYLYSMLKMNDEFLDKQRHTSWQALPILNEWHAQFPNEDPVAIHERIFREKLRCPSGKGYQWNAEDATMESVHFGHPGNPRGEAIEIPLAQHYTRAMYGVTFADEGVRAVSTLDNYEYPEESSSKDNAVIGEELATLEELVIPVAGASWTYRTTSTFDDQVITYVNNRVSIEETAEGLKMVDHDEWVVPEEETLHWKTHLLMSKDGWMITYYEDDEGRTEYSEPYQLLPPTFREREGHQSQYNSRWIPKDGSGPMVDIGKVTHHIAGMETVTVPAGTFDAVRIESTYAVTYDDMLDLSKETLWYAKGVGLVKSEWTNGTDSETYELTQYSIPESP